MAPVLIDAAVSRAYVLAGCSAALEAARDPGPGLATLAVVIYRLLPRLTLEMVLEILSVTGRLPSYDSIVTALRSGSARDRGYAMENIEQGAGRKLFARIEPLLDDRPVAEVVRAGRLFGFDEPTDVAFAIDRSIRVRFPLEAGAALQALHETRPDAAAVAALEILRQNPAPLLRETALTLLGRMEGASREKLTPVERIQALSRGGFFRGWGVRQLEFVGRHLREMTGVAGRTLAPRTRETDGLHVIVHGTFVVNGLRRGPGENFGGESLFGRDPRREEVRAETEALARSSFRRTTFLPARAFIPRSRSNCCAASSRLSHETTPLPFHHAGLVPAHHDAGAHPRQRRPGLERLSVPAGHHPPQLRAKARRGQHDRRGLHRCG